MNENELKHELVHLHRETSGPVFNIFYLLIPSLVFVLVLVGAYKFLLDGGSSNRGVGSEVVAVDQTDKSLTLDGKEVFVEVVDDEVGRRTGLSGRTSLGEKEGMLFIFDSADIRPAFWMKDMNFAIDIVWINDSRVVQIDRNVLPQPGVSDNKLSFYVSNEPVDYVVELNAGFCERNLIEVGDEVDLSKALPVQIGL